MKTLNDIGLPKDILKKKKFRLYKAYILKDGDEMNVQADIDIYGLDFISATKYLLSNMDINQLMELSFMDNDKQRSNPTLISFLILTFDTEDIINKPLLLTDSDIYYKDNNLSVSIRDKPYKISVQDKYCKDVKIEINPENEIKTITNLVLE